MRRASHQRTLQRSMQQSRAALRRPQLWPEPTSRTGLQLLVVDSYVVQRIPGAPLHYELHLAPKVPPDQRPLVLLTNKADIYQLALELEGASRPCDCTYHQAIRKSGQVCFILDSLTRTE